MALLSYYEIGFASVENGAKAVTGTGTQWLTALRENDVFVGADGRSVRIASVNSATSLTLAREWPGDSQTSDVYEVRITPAPSEITASVRKLLEKLRQGLWLTPNATGTLAERAAFDSARRGFIYMQTDVDPFVVFVKQTDTESDWSPGFSPQQGPSGPFTTIEIGTVTTLAPDQPATIDPVQEGDVVTLNFGIPRGPTGDIDGVTPFWVTRLGSDADAAAARAGLQALGVGDFGIGGTSMSEVTDPNTISQNGLFQINAITGQANTPTARRFNGIHMQRASDRIAQIMAAVDAGFPDPRIFTRVNDGTWRPWRELYHQGNILGTVTQSGGVPTGAIVERGSNANGSFVRFADGTQICTHIISGVTAPSATGSVFTSGAAGSFPWTFPAAFAVAPIVSASVNHPTSWANALDSSSTSVEFRRFSSAAQTGGENVRLAAIGRWF